MQTNGAKERLTAPQLHQPLAEPAGKQLGLRESAERREGQGSARLTRQGQANSEEGPRASEVSAFPPAGALVLAFE